MNASPFLYAVTGDHSRMVYSRHRSLKQARLAAERLARKWAPSHPGSEPRIVDIVTGEDVESVPR